MRKLTIKEMGRIDAAEFKRAGKLPLTVVLDNVRSMNNIGSFFRTSDAFRVKEIILCGITSTPPAPEIYKTALGAEESVDWRYFADAHDAVRELKQAGCKVLAVEQCEGSLKLDTWEPDYAGGKADAAQSGQATLQEYAVIFGNEVDGVQQSVIDLCDGCIEIPQYGIKHSLNVSIAAGIVIWHFFRAFEKIRRF